MAGVVAPRAIAVLEACWMVRPSSIGSENGSPISTASTPAPASIIAARRPATSAVTFFPCAAPPRPIPPVGPRAPASITAASRPATSAAVFFPPLFDARAGQRHASSSRVPGRGRNQVVSLVTRRPGVLDHHAVPLDEFRDEVDSSGGPAISVYRAGRGPAVLGAD